MRALFNSKPILSFILLTFLITFFFWLLPVVVILPKDINLVIILIGGFKDLLPRFIWMIPYTIIFTWLYNKSSYSILAVVILHAMLNNTSKALGYSEIGLTVLVILLCVYCIIDDKMWKKKSYHLIYQEKTIKASS